MITKTFDIKREYRIKCKAYAPSEGDVKRVILGVHGFAGDKESSMLLELAKGIEPNGGALICFDFPAHGDSEADEKHLTVENCIGDLLAVSDWISKNYPTANKFVFATSFGGYISLLASEKLKDYRMILRAPAVTMPKVLLESVLKITPEQFKEQRLVECGFERKIRLPYTFYENLVRYNPFDMEYKNEMLIIHGDKDDIVPIGDVEAFKETHDKVNLLVMKNADHRFKNSGEMDYIVHETLKFMEKCYG